MTSLKIAHIADTHLRASQYSHEERGEDFYKAFAAAIQLAHDNGADFIVHCGDFFDRPTLTSAVGNLYLARIERLLQKLNLVMFAIEGNHERAEPPWLYREDVDVHNPKPGIVLLRNDRVVYKVISILGMGFCSNEEFQSFITPYTEQNPWTDILLWHSQIREFCGFPTESAITMAEMPLNHFGSILMGDIHDTKYHRPPCPELNAACEILGYPGSSELCEQGEPMDKWLVILDYQVMNGPRAKLQDLKMYPIPQLPKYALRVTCEEEMPELLHKLRDIKGRALVFLRYAQGIEECLNRCRAVIDPTRVDLRPTTIVQYAKLIRQALPGEAQLPDAEDDEDKPLMSVKDLLHTFLSIEQRANGAFVSLAEALVTPDVDYDTLIKAYANKALGLAQPISQ